MHAMRKVLVVDDDPVVSKSFDRVLARKGYVVVSAENGQEALNKVAKEDYDAVFTDIKMPGMSGLEVAERLRAKRPWTPVVIITGYGSAENEARAEAAGVRGFLRKPLSPEMIESSLDDAVAETVPPAAEMVPSGGFAAAAEAGATALTAPRPLAADAANEAVSVGRFLKNVALFFAAPFIALAYIALFPLIGLVMLARTGGQAWRKRHASASALEADATGLAAPQPEAVGEENVGGGVGRFLKNIALFFAAPFITLAFVGLFPLIGLVMLAWTGGQALRNRGTAG